MGMRGICAVACLLASLMVANVASASIRLPDNAAHRDQVMERLRRICRDYPLTAERNDAGQWFVRKGARITLPTEELVYDAATDSYTVRPVGEQPSNVTAKGCKLVCDLVNHARELRLEAEPGRRGPATDPQDRAKLGDAFNGVGTDTKIRYNPDDSDTRFYGFAPDGTEIEMPIDVALAHEMIHALHGMNGTTKKDMEGQTIDGSSPGGAGGHGVTENDIREEQNKLGRRPPLKMRKGHDGCIR